MIRFEYSSNGPGRIYKGHERAYSRGREAYIWGGGLLFRGLGRVCIVLRPLNKKIGFSSPPASTFEARVT